MLRDGKEHTFHLYFSINYAYIELSEVNVSLFLIFKSEDTLW